MRYLVLAASALLFAAPAHADEAPAKAAEGPVAGVPVYPYDITDRPYTVIGPVTAGVRKATIFSHAASQDKIYAVLWKNARKLGADAVIKTTYGESHVTALSWGKTNVSGTAIKFMPAPAAPAAAPAPARVPATAPTAAAVPVPAPADGAGHASR